MEKLIFIGGGVGPMAGVNLHRKIIENTNVNGDPDHPSLFHASTSAHIPDRTEFLKGNGSINPAEGMFEVAKDLWKIAAQRQREAVFGVPCNTFHAPKIFDRLKFLLEENGVQVQLVHMIEETIKLIQTALPNLKCLGLMSTTGTRQVGVYSQALIPLGIEIVEVPEDVQGELHDTIYNPVWGLKATSTATDRARENFEKYAEMLINQGAEALILGCTEIPIALPQKQIGNVPLIDPVYALARALVREACAEKLKPLMLGAS